ncbi:hypothetical protein A9Q99_01770 [Gammaproteobacteria bacterium 45_16_T64]|nr:hypothetical protein A9Q99_01770 [Gammaproteobacteria bacterium 45_16_T64]
MRIICLFLFGICSISFADESRVRLEIAHGGTQDYPPFEIMVEGKLAGVHADLIRAVAAKLNWTISFKNVPWARALVLLEAGGVDAVSYISKRPERERYTYFLPGNTLSFVENTFFTYSNNTSPILYSGDMLQLKDHTVVTTRAFSYNKTFDDASYIRKYAVNTLAQQIKLITSRRYELGIANKTDLHIAANRMGLREKITIITPSVSRLPAYLGFSKTKKHIVLAEQFATALTQFKKSQAYQHVLNRYNIPR